MKQPLTRRGRGLARLALVAALFVAPATARAQTLPNDLPPAVDVLGNCENVATGAAFRPQTPAEIWAHGGELRDNVPSPGIAVAGVQAGPAGAPLDALGQPDNVGSGAVFMPQTAASIVAHGGALTVPIDVAGVQATGPNDSCVR